VDHRWHLIISVHTKQGFVWLQTLSNTIVKHWRWCYHWWFFCHILKLNQLSARLTVIIESLIIHLENWYRRKLSLIIIYLSLIIILSLIIVFSILISHCLRALKWQSRIYTIWVSSKRKAWVLMLSLRLMSAYGLTIDISIVLSSHVLRLELPLLLAPIVAQNTRFIIVSLIIYFDGALSWWKCGLLLETLSAHLTRIRVLVCGVIISLGVFLLEPLFLESLLGDNWMLIFEFHHHLHGLLDKLFLPLLFNHFLSLPFHLQPYKPLLFFQSLSFLHHFFNFQSILLCFPNHSFLDPLFLFLNFSIHFKIFFNLFVPIDLWCSC
jgi:hypothetical protein